RFRRRQALQDRAHLGIEHLTAEAVAAEQKRVANFERKWPFEIDLHIRMRTERSRDDVLRHEAGHGPSCPCLENRYSPARANGSGYSRPRRCAAVHRRAARRAISDTCAECR